MANEQTSPKEDTAAEAQSSKGSDTYYAWSPIDYGAEFEPDAFQPGGRIVVGRKTVAVGGEVDPGKLDLREDQFKQLVDSGAIRTTPMPDTLIDPLVSPRDKMLEMHGLTEGFLSAGYFAPDVIEQLSQAAAAVQAVDDARLVGANTDTRSGTAEVGG